MAHAIGTARVSTILIVELKLLTGSDPSPRIDCNYAACLMDGPDGPAQRGPLVLAMLDALRDLLATLGSELAKSPKAAGQA
jgi:hypothetical protein